MDKIPILFDVIYEFVSPFFLGVHMTDPQPVYLLTMVLTVAFFYGLIIRPILWLFGVRGKK